VAAVVAVVTLVLVEVATAVLVVADMVAKPHPVLVMVEGKMVAPTSAVAEAVARGTPGPLVLLVLAVLVLLLSVT
jgi:hypothetical protein